MKRTVSIFFFFGWLCLAACGPGTVVKEAVRTQVASTLQAERALREAEATLVAAQVATGVAATAQVMAGQAPGTALPGGSPAAAASPGPLPGDVPPTPELSRDAINAENASSMTQAYQQGLGVPGPVTFSPDGTRLAVGSSLGVYLYDSASLKLLSFLPTLDWVRSIAFSPDGQRLAAGGYENAAVLVWNTGDGKLVNRLPPLGDGDIIDQVAFSGDGFLVAAAGSDVIGIYSLATGQLTRLIQDVENTLAFCFSADGADLFAIGNYHRSDEFTTYRPYFVQISTAAGEIISEREPDWGLGGLETAAFSPDGSLAALGLDSGVILVMESLSGQVLQRLVGSQDAIQSLSFSEDNRWLVSSTYQDFTLWSLPDGSQTWSIAAPSMYRSAFHPLTGQLAVSDWTTGEVRLLSLQDAAVLGKIVLGIYHRSAIPSPGGEYLVVGSDLGVSLWSFPGLDSLLRFEGLVSDERTFRLSSNLAFSPDGRMVTGGIHIIGKPPALMIWDLANGKKELEVPGYASRVVIAPDGTWVAAGYDRVQIIDLVKAAAVRELDLDLVDLADMAVSPDGAWLAVVDSQEAWGQEARGTVHLFQMPAASPAAAFEITGSSLKAAIFTPDSQHLVIATNDDLQVWSVGVQPLLLDQIALPSYVYANCLAFNPMGDVLAIGAYLQTILLSFPGGIILDHLQGHTSHVFSVAFTPDGSALVTASADGTVRVWKVKD